MFTSSGSTPLEELVNRQNNCIKNLKSMLPEAGGILICDRVSIYYFTGTLASGLFWLPVDSSPVLLVRKSVERARIESPIPNIVEFKSYSEISSLIVEFSKSLPNIIATEKNILPWALADLLMQKLPNVKFLAGDNVVLSTRAIKTPWEIYKMSLAGNRHEQAMCLDFPKLVKAGMTEREISHLIWNVYFSLGHCGKMRMNSFGEEVFLGHISAGNSGAYPSYYNGALGVMGEHPAVPFMGNAGVIWQKNSLLSVDAMFCLEGYHTDKTQVFFSGKEQDIPSEVFKAHEFCCLVEEEISKNLKPGAIPADLYNNALKMAEKYGFSENFLGVLGNKVAFLGHSIGLKVDETPVIAKQFTSPLEENMTIAIEPKITVSSFGMVGTENTYLVTKFGGKSLTGLPGKIICIN